MDLPLVCASRPRSLLPCPPEADVLPPPFRAGSGSSQPVRTTSAAMSKRGKPPNKARKQPGAARLARKRLEPGVDVCVLATFRRPLRFHG